MGVQHPWRDVLLHNVALHRGKAQLFPEASLPGVSAPQAQAQQTHVAAALDDLSQGLDALIL